MKKELSLFALAALAAVFISVGCGGTSVPKGNNASGLVKYSGTTTTTGNLTSNATVPATGGTTVQTTADGIPDPATIPSGALPAGSTVSPADTLAIIPLGTGFPGTFSSGLQLSVNGVSDSGIGVSSTGATQQNMALPVSPGAAGTLYTLSYPGGDLKTTPAIGQVNPFVLTIHSTVFTGKFYVLINGGRAQVISPVPIDLAGRIPNNGQNAVGSVVKASFGPGNNGRTATLTVDYGTGFALNQTRTITGNAVTFSNLKQDTSNVPTTGIAVLSLKVGDLP
jgi:hypothetical protein